MLKGKILNKISSNKDNHKKDNNIVLGYGRIGYIGMLENIMCLKFNEEFQKMKKEKNGNE